MASDDRLATLIAAHLCAKGWREVQPGGWACPGQRLRRRSPTLHTLLAAAQVQITHEYYESQRLERERLGLGAS